MINSLPSNNWKSNFFIIRNSECSNLNYSNNSPRGWHIMRCKSANGMNKITNIFLFQKNNLIDYVSYHFKFLVVVYLIVCRHVHVTVHQTLISLLNSAPVIKNRHIGRLKRRKQQCYYLPTTQNQKSTIHNFSVIKGSS